MSALLVAIRIIFAILIRATLLLLLLFAAIAATELAGLQV